jgi:hypothetical protein
MNKYEISSFTSESRTFIFKADANNNQEIKKEDVQPIKKFKYNNEKDTYKKPELHLNINDLNEFPPL